MKKIYLLFLILFTFTTTAVFSQTSHDKISYQSVVRDGNNHLLYDTSVTVVVTIKNSGDPAVKYRETHTVMSNANGLISFLIGGGSNPSGSWDAVQWNHADITLVTSVNGTVLSTHTYPLSAVPYALYAKGADAAAYADSMDLDVVQHYLDQNGYLPEVPQVLSISNDTIFLTRGGYVKLPAGFSGDYNDLTNKPDLKPVATSGDYNDLVNKPTKSDLCDSVKDCVTGWISDSTQMVFDTLHNYYATKNALRDTASALRDVITAEVTQLQNNIDTVSGHVRGALIDTASDIRGALVDTAAAIRADMGDAAHDAKITIQKNGVTVGDFTLNQATPDTIDITVPTKVTDLEDAGNYVTKAKLSDTLSRYTTSNKIDTLLGNYATTTYVKDTLKAYFDTTLTKKAIHDTANALRGEFPTVNNGKITIAMNRGTVDEATFYVNQDGEQTVMINLPDEALVNDGQLTIITDGDTTRFTANQATNDTVNLSDFVTTARLNDTLSSYTTTDAIDSIVNKHHFLTSDSALIVRMRDSIQKVNAHVSADSLVLATRMDTLLKHVCDTVKPCVTDWINDTLKAYTTTNEIDTIVDKHHFLTSDSMLIVRMRDSIQKVNAHVSADSLVLATRMDTLLKHVCDSVKPCVTGWVNDTLKAYTTTDKIDTIVNKHHFLTSDSALIVRMRDSIQKVNAHVSADSLVLATRMDTLLKHVCDTVKPCVTGWINDTLKAYTTTNEIDTIVNKHHFLTSDSALIVRMRDSIQKVNAHVSADSLVLATRMDTLLKHVCDSVKPCVTDWMNDTLKAYTTTDKIDTIVNKHHFLTSDSALIVRMRDSIQKVNAHVSADSLVLATRMDTLLKHVCDTVKPCVTGWMNDTLKAYTTTNEIDTIVNKHHYLTSDSALIVRMRDSIQVNATAIQANATNIGINKQAIIDSSAHIRNDIKNGQITIAVNRSTTTTETTVTNPTFGVNQEADQTVTITIPQETTVNNGQLTIVAAGDTTRFTANQATNDTMRLNKFATKDTLSKYTTTDKIDTIINKHHFLTSDSALIVRMRDSIQKVNAHVSADSLVLATRIHADSLKLATRMDTLLKHVCDTVKPCVTGWMNDTLKYYTTTNKIDTIVNKHHFLTSDSALIVRMRDSIQKVDAHVSADSLVLANRIHGDSLKLATRMDTLLKHVCDTVKPCVTGWINDTLKAYTTTDEIDTIVNKHHFLTSDSALIVRMRDSIQKVNAHVSADSLVLATRMDTLLKHVCDTVKPCVTGWINDTLKAYTTTDEIDTIVNKHHFLTSDSALIVRMRDSIQKVDAHVSADSLVLANRIHGDSLKLATRMDTLLKHVCDTVKPCVTGWMNDTLKYYTTTNKIDTIVNKHHFLTSDSALIIRMRDSIQKVNAHVSADSLVLATRMDTLLKHVCDTVKPCVTGWVNDTLKAYTTTNEIDSIVNKHHFLTSDSALIVRMRDSIQKVNAHVSADSLVLATRMDTLLKHVCDTVKPCVTGWIYDTLKAYTTTNEIDSIVNKHHFLTSDSALIVRMRDSIQKVNAHVSADSLVLATRIHGDSLKLATRMDTVLKHVCDTVKPCVTGWMNDTLKYYTTTNKIDTIVNKHHFLTSDSALIVRMRDSIQKVNAHVSADSLVLANRIHADSLKLATRMDTLLKHVCDTVKPCVTGWINDTLKAYYDTTRTKKAIHDSIGNGKITIQKNGATITDGSFNLNQKTDQTINITVPTTVAELTDEANYAKVAANNQFTGTNTVPNGYVLKGDNATNGTNCGNIVVNACDLWAVFDSLTKRIDALQQELNELKNSTPPVFNSLTLSEATATTMKVTANFTSTGAAITSYQFCYKKTDATEDAQCITSTSNEITLDGLDPFTSYDVTASATNFAGTTPSTTTATDRTLAHKPAGTLNSTMPQKPFGFQVTVSDLDFKEVTEGTVRVFYTKKSGECGTDTTAYTSADPSSVLHTNNSYVVTINGLEPLTDYCVIARVSNVDSTYVTEPLTATSGEAITLDIQYSPSTISLCGSSPTNVEFTATPSAGTDYEYSWSDGTNAFNGNPVIIPFSTEGEKTITCTATNSTEDYSISGSVAVTATVVGVTPSFTTCDDSLTVVVKTLTPAEGCTIMWYDEDTPESVAVEDDNTYSQAGTYNITVTNGGCSASQSVTLSSSQTKISTRPCTVSPSHPAQTNFIGGGYNNANDGLEDLVNGKINSVVDYDGNVYSVVEIGSQCWLAENLRCTHAPSDGQYILQVPSGTTPINTDKARVASWYMNDAAQNSYLGLLYNYPAALDVYRDAEYNPNIDQSIGTDIESWFPSTTENRRGLCPKGWHLPTNGEYQTMLSTTNAENYAGKLAKGCDWNLTTGSIPNPYTPGSYDYSDRGSSAFGALPAGFVASGTFQDKGVRARLWNSTTSNDDQPRFVYLVDGSQFVQSTLGLLNSMNSIRCLRDETCPAFLSLSSDLSSEFVSLCNSQDVTVTYTATVKTCGEDNPAGYTYTWIVPDGLTYVTNDQNQTCQVTYNTPGNYTIRCQATLGESQLTDSVIAQVVESSSFIFTICVDEYSKSVTVLSDNVASVSSWGGTGTLNGDTYTYANSGVYTIEATSPAGGCPVIKTVAVGDATNRPCTSISMGNHARQTSGTTLSPTDGVEAEGGVSGTIVSVSDFEGHVYPVVEIGTQCWMKRNLRTLHYSDGTKIDTAPIEKTETYNYYHFNLPYTEQHRCCYTPTMTDNGGHDAVDASYTYKATYNEGKYGLYYNWYAAADSTISSSNPSNVQGACPTGWHLPSISEWNQLLNSVNNNSYVLTSGCQWTSNPSQEYNSSEFSAVPTGYVNPDPSSPSYKYLVFTEESGGLSTRFWATDNPKNNATRSYFKLMFNSTLTSSRINARGGCSVRCVRD